MRALVCLLGAVCACVALPNVYKMEMEEAEIALSAAKTRQQLFHVLNEDPSRGPARLTSFSYKDCGGPSALVSISALSVTPDPLVFPGPLNVATDFKIKSDLGQPLKGDVYIAKKVLGKFVKLPCVDNFGSCTYPDLCLLLEQVQCPDPIVRIGIDCMCPLKANSYSLPKTDFEIDASVIPAGDYMVRGNATYMGKEGACLELTLSFQ